MLLRVEGTVIKFPFRIGRVIPSHSNSVKKVTRNLYNLEMQNLEIFLQGEQWSSCKVLFYNTLQWKQHKYLTQGTVLKNTLLQGLCYAHIAEG